MNKRLFVIYEAVNFQMNLFVQVVFRGDSIITSNPEKRWVYAFFMILRDSKLGGWVVLD